MASNRNARKTQYLEAMLTSSSQKQACKKAHISRATARRYEQDPDFKAAYKKMQQQSMEFTGNQLRALTGKAVASLSSILDDPKATPADRTRAAKIILDAAFHVQQTEDILQRLDALEAEVNN